MSAYQAVVTTGIYCRPGCSGRPNPGNVVGYELAAAAEAAGFRACLRCRPYRTSEPLGTAGPELVCRAVQLVLDGALDRGREAELGARLGVSPRHLRRLFHEHLGVTPDQLARSRRAHFARRLLDDSDLTVTEAAFASGFGSVRQLNRAFWDLFRATPGELRARRRSTDRLVADVGALELRLPFRPPLEWEAMLRYFALRAIPGVEAAVDGAYRRTVIVDGNPGVIEVSRGGPDHLLLRAHLPQWEGLIHVTQRVRRSFGLDTDLAATERLAGDELAGPLVAARPGLRVPGTWDAFETGVRAIIGQQVTVAGASTITGRVAARYGKPVPGLAHLRLTHTFPSPETLLAADFASLGLTAARIEAIRQFARAVADDRVRLDRSVGLDALVDSITALPGLGPWTAHYIALRLGEPDAFPASDLGLRRALAAPGGRLPSIRAVQRRADAWRPHRAQAAVHLWASDGHGIDTPASEAFAVAG